MTNFTLSTSSKLVASAILAVGLMGCGSGGGGGGSSLPGTAVTLSGTAARGAALANAAIDITCANTERVQTTANASGAYSVPATVVYPCVGTATAGAISYRGILFSGSVANFTPLTDLLVETVLAASATGPTSLTVASFLELARTNSTFATSVTSASNALTYRNAVINVVRAQLIAAGRTPEQADATLAAAANFNSVAFVIGSAQDQVLDNTGPIILNVNGTVKITVIVSAKNSGDSLPAPTTGNSGTGGTGGTGGSGT